MPVGLFFPGFAAGRRQRGSGRQRDLRDGRLRRLLAGGVAGAGATRRRHGAPKRSRYSREMYDDHRRAQSGAVAAEPRLCRRAVRHRHPQGGRQRHPARAHHRHRAQGRRGSARSARASCARRWRAYAGACSPWRSASTCNSHAEGAHVPARHGDRAASPCRAGRRCGIARRRQRGRSDGRRRGDHRRRLSAHEQHRRRRLLADQPSRASRPVGIDACGRAAGLATPDWYRKRGHAAIPSRGPLAANTVAGAVSGWQRSARRERRTAAACRACSRTRSGTRAKGHRSRRARSTTRRSSWTNSRRNPALPATFLRDGRPPQARSLQRFPALAATFERLARARPRRLLPRRNSRTHWRRSSSASAARCAATTSHRHHASIVDAARGRTLGRHGVQPAAADARAGVADDPGALRPHPRRRRGRHLRARARHRRSDQAGVPGAQPPRLRSGRDARRCRRLPARRRDRRTRPRHRSATGATVAGAGDQGRHRVDGRGRPRRLHGELHPERVLGVRLGRRARRHRRQLAEPRRELLARPRRRTSRSRPGASRSTRSIRRWRDLPTAARWSMATWAATASRRARPRCSAATRCSARTCSRRSARRAGCSGRTWGEMSVSLKLESRFDPSLVAALREAGHEVEVVEAYSDLVGHAGALVRHPDGVIAGAADPRSDGAVAATARRRNRGHACWRSRSSRDCAWEACMACSRSASTSPMRCRTR